MCDPITISGIALSGAGVAANAVGAGKVADATSASLAQNLQKQNALDQQAAGVNAHSLGLYSDMQGQQDAKSKDLGDMFLQASAPVASSPANEAPAGSANTQQNESAAKAITQGFNNQQALSGAKVKSFGDVLSNDALAQGRDASQINQINDFKRGDQNVLGLELNQDSHAGDGWDLAGSLASGLGGIGIKAGLGGAANKLGGLTSGKSLFGLTGGTPAPSFNPFAIV